MSEPFSQHALCFTWRSYHNDELSEWAVDYSPCMGDVEAFEIKTPLGECQIDDLDTLRGIHAMLGEAIKKAEELHHNERTNGNG